MGIELIEDEEEVLNFHPHWKTILGPLLLAVIIAAVAVAGVVFITNTTARMVIGGLAIVLIVIVLAVPITRWACTSYILTSRRFVLRIGILNRHGRDIPLNRVNDVSFDHSLIDRVLRCGKLTVESAGERGQLVLRNIPQVEHVQNEMYRLIEDEQQRLYRGDEEEAHPRPAG
ncbi:MAG TPA: PH domain-containing protein [Streptosporangiaceae bacterium]|jgi:uncharacterized membrane protein YdbT with pleckstrin-like domain